MGESIWKYVIAAYRNVPESVYLGVISFYLTGSLIIISFRGFMNSLRIIGRLLVIGYVILLLFLTVFSRSFQSSHNYNLFPFWSYKAIWGGQEELLAENIMNVIVFIPVGFLLGCSFNRVKIWIILLCGCYISISIELSQFILKRGFTEVDDVMHNTLGCLIGFAIYSLIRMGYMRIGKRGVEVG